MYLYVCVCVCVCLCLWERILRLMNQLLPFTQVTKHKRNEITTKSGHQQQQTKAQTAAKVEFELS